MAVASNLDWGIELPANFRRKFDDWERKSSKSVSILVSGKTGAGKSTLVNKIVGRNVATVGDTLDPGTGSVKGYKLKVQDITVKVWDSPGLQDGTTNEAKYLKSIQKQCKDVDLFLYCIRMNERRFVHDCPDVQAMKKLTETLGEGLWNNAIIVLTRANSIVGMAKSKFDNDTEKIEQEFEKRLQMWRDTLVTRLTDNVGLSEETATSIQILPAGFNPTVKLPCPSGSFWLSTLWVKAIHVTKSRAQLAVIKVNKHCFATVSDEPIEQKLQDEIAHYHDLLFQDKGEEIGRECGIPPIVARYFGLLKRQGKKKNPYTEIIDNIERTQIGLQREAQLRKVEQRLREAEERLQEVNQLLEEANQRARTVELMAQDVERRAELQAQENIQQLQRATQRAALAEQRAQQQVQRVQREAEGRIQEANHLFEEANQRARTAEARVQDLERQAQQVRERPQEEEHWVVERDEIVLTNQELGRGGWGEVRVAKFRGSHVAAKSLFQQISPFYRRLFIREMTMAARLRHPNLVQFIGATLDREPVILTELMTTSVRAVLEQGPIGQAQIISISLDIARALNYLHEMKPDPMIHRDISSANVLLDPLPNNHWKAKVSDYGSVNLLQQLRTVGPGSPVYAAPEANFPAQQSPKMDIFSFGVLLIEMVTDEFPEVASRNRLILTIQDPRFEDLIRRCLDEEKDNRPSANELITNLH